MSAPRISTEGAAPVAYASSMRRDGMPAGAPRRWTELRVWYRQGERRPFLAEVCGFSTFAGEVPRVRQRVAKTTAEALAFFESSDLTEEVAKQVQAWEDKRAAGRARDRFTGATLREALQWLYGDNKTDGALSVRFEAAWHVPARTVRHSLKQEAEGKDLPSWCNAWLVALAMFYRSDLRESGHAE